MTCQFCEMKIWDELPKTGNRSGFCHNCGTDMDKTLLNEASLFLIGYETSPSKRHKVSISPPLPCSHCQDFIITAWLDCEEGELLDISEVMHVRSTHENVSIE